MPRTRAAAAAAKDKITKSTVTVKRSAVKKKSEDKDTSRPKRKAAVRTKTATKAPTTTTKTTVKRKPTKETVEPKKRSQRTTKTAPIDFVTRNKENVRTTEAKATTTTITAKKQPLTPRTSKAPTKKKTPTATPQGTTENLEKSKVLTPLPSGVKQVEQAWALASFDREVEAKVAALRLLKGSLLQQLQADRAVQFARLPKAVREMNLDELQNQYQGDMNKAHRSAMGQEWTVAPMDLSGLLEISASDLSELSQQRRDQLRQHLESLVACLE